jgi:hypothetical protein
VAPATNGAAAKVVTPGAQAAPGPAPAATQAAPAAKPVMAAGRGPALVANGNDRRGK